MGRSLTVGIFGKGGSLRVGEGEEVCRSRPVIEGKEPGEWEFEYLRRGGRPWERDPKCKYLRKFSKKSKLHIINNQRLN